MENDFATTLYRSRKKSTALESFSCSMCSYVVGSSITCAFRKHTLTTLLLNRKNCSYKERLKNYTSNYDKNYNGDSKWLNI